jgi:hypothetical protein
MNTTNVSALARHERRARLGVKGSRSPAYGKMRAAKLGKRRR